MKLMPVLALVFSLMALAPTSHAQDATKPDPDQEAARSPWLELTSDERREVERFASAYKAFMHEAKTELTFVAEAVELAREAGFVELTQTSNLTPGARFYDVNRDRAMALIVVGDEEMLEGFQVLGAHIDSPRLELKPRALYEAQGFALFQTNYHGWIKTYQWTNIPLALMGRVDKKDGSTIPISVGNQPGDPVFVIADLSPHVDSQLRERTAPEVIELEEMDPLVGHIPASAQRGVKAAVAAYLEQTYGIETDDLVSAELALVPAMPPRDVGFDRGLMAIYGQDDRASGYAALRAALDTRAPSRTAIAYLVDNEEVGNVNNTGSSSTYLVDLMGLLLLRQMGEDYQEHVLRRALRATRVVSADVNPGLHPIWPSAWEPTNAPRLGHGINLKLYGRGFNANSEYIAWIRAMLDEEDIPWQTATYKVGPAGGGTIGATLSDDNMEVIDFGIPILSIHTPYSVSSKLDVYYLYRAMKAFCLR